MKKIMVVMILMVMANVKADGNTMTQNDNQFFNDEGYGNTDAEYYCSEDNNEEAPGSQNEATGNIDEQNSAGNDVQ